MFVASVFILFSSLSLSAASETKVTVTEINSSGQVNPTTWRHSTELTWSADPTGKIPSRLVLRVWLELPAEWKFKRLISRSASRVAKVRESPFAQPRGEVIAVDLIQPNEHITLAIENRATQKVTEMGLLIRQSPMNFRVMVHESCEIQGVSLLPLADLKGSGYIGLACGNVVGDRVPVLISHSSDWRIGASSVKVPTDSGQNWQLIEGRTENSKRPLTMRWLMKSVSTPSVAKRVGVRFVDTMPRWLMSVGLGATGLYYSETGPSLSAKSRQIGATFKAGAAYALLPGSLWVRLSGYFNGVMVGVGTSAPAARFWGVNPSLQWVVPTTITSGALSVTVGAYLWGMIVPEDAAYPNKFGIALNSGPVFQIGYRMNPQRRSPFSLYLKYAPTAPILSWAPTNAEWAIGFSVPIIRSRSSGLTWSISSDFSTLGLNVENYTNDIRLTTFSLGLGLEF